MLPFTREQFLAVFVAYNEAVWPVQVLAYLLGLLMMALVMRPSAQRSRVVAAGLAAMWLWTGVAYHGMHFSSISNGAPVIWSVIGGSAAFQLGIPQDWPLFVSGVTVLALLRRDRHRGRDVGDLRTSQSPSAGVRHETP